MNRLALFDCDGTLVDSQHSIRAALEVCFAEAGLDLPPPERTRRIVGLSLVEAMADLLPDAPDALHVDLAEGYKRAFQAMRAAGPVDEPLFPGVADLLDRLEADGWLLGVATGKSDRGLALCLGCHDLHHRFVTLQTADRHPSKPHPSMAAQAMADAGSRPETTVVIGDTSYDMGMARNAGATAVGVAWGYHDPLTLWAAGANHVIDHPRELIDIVQAVS